MVPFEITAINLILSYWRDDIPVAAVCAVCIVLYAYGFPTGDSAIISKHHHPRNPEYLNNRTKHSIVP